MVEQKSNRIEWIDTAKGIGILLVIFAHINTGIVAKWIYSFHMPLFFFLSGYVFRVKDNFGLFFKKKVRSIIVPYFCLGVIMVLFQICRNYVEGKFTVHSSLVLVVELCQQIRFWTLWYIACLLGLYFIFYFLVKYIKSERILFLIVIIMTVGGVIYAKTGGSPLPWNIDACFPTSLFFYIGYQAKNKFGNADNEGKRPFYVFIMALLLNIIGFAIIISMSDEVLDISASRYPCAPLSYCVAICGIICISIISNKMTQLSLLKYIGKNSMLYYAWHQQIFIPLIYGVFYLVGIRQNTYSSGALQLIVDIVITGGIVILMTITNQIIVHSRFKFIIGK